MKAKLVKREDRYDLYDGNDHKIASTLDGAGNKLSLKNCQAIANGYDLDELADDFIRCPEDMRTLSEDREINSFKKGFQKALELMGDKKFSEEDVINLIKKSREKKPYNFDGKSTEYKFLEDELIQSLQQTEWDVEIEIDEEKEFIFDPAMGISQGHYLDKPKLDADGCLILKRILHENRNHRYFK